MESDRHQQYCSSGERAGEESSSTDYRAPTSIANILRQKFTRHTELFRAGEKLTCKHGTSLGTGHYTTTSAAALLESGKLELLVNKLMSGWVSLNVKFWQHEGNLAFMINLFLITIQQGPAHHPPPPASLQFCVEIRFAVKQR